MPLWLAYNQKDHPRIDLLKIEDYKTLLFGLGLKGWNVGKGYGIMCNALGSAWGTPWNLGKTVAASCPTIGNFMGHFRGQGEPAPTKLAPSPSWMKPFSGHINVRNWPLWMPFEPFHCLHEVSVHKTAFLFYAILLRGRVPMSHLNNLLCKTRNKVLGEFFHFQTAWIFAICQIYIFRKNYTSKYSFFVNLQNLKKTFKITMFLHIVKASSQDIKGFF